MTDRQTWMGLLARADESRLAGLWQATGLEPRYELLRGPEEGLVMVRGRAGATGGAFNLGEMTVTRCTVRLSSGVVGHAYVAGRRARHAERAAVIDAMLQEDARGRDLNAGVLLPLDRDERTARDSQSRKSAATKVDFFTLVRGEDE